MTRHDDYRELFKSAPLGILVADPGSRRFIAANPAICRLLGYSEAELLQLGVGDIHPPEQLVAVTAQFDALAQGDLARTLDCPCLRRDRSVFHADISAALITFAGRQAVAGFFADTTERWRAQAEKEKLEAQSRDVQKAESLGRMAGAIAHHFNNRLQAVMGMLELALEDLPRDADVLGALNAAMGSAREATKISTLMLAYLGQTPGMRAPLDLAEACRQFLPSLQAKMPTKVSLDLDLPSPGPIIQANPNQMQQLLANLVTNAWEAVGDCQGTIRVTVKFVVPAEIPAAHRVPSEWLPQDDAYACLEVADSGCGISQKARATLFDPFFSSKFTGRGLGLPVVKGITKSHGGVIIVESEPGRGTTFGIYLPRVTAEACTDPATATPSSLPPGGAGILTTEDENPLRQASGGFLELLA